MTCVVTRVVTYVAWLVTHVVTRAVHCIHSYIRLILSYGLRHYNVAERATAETLAFHILVQDRPTAVEDALRIVRFYEMNPGDVYLFRIK